MTEQGFQFLLLDTYSQLWRLLRAYIAGGESRSGASLISIHTFCGGLEPSKVSKAQEDSMSFCRA